MGTAQSSGDAAHALSLLHAELVAALATARRAVIAGRLRVYHAAWDVAHSGRAEFGAPAPRSASSPTNHQRARPMPQHDALNSRQVYRKILASAGAAQGEREGAHEHRQVQPVDPPAVPVTIVMRRARVVQHVARLFFAALRLGIAGAAKERGLLAISSRHRETALRARAWERWRRRSGQRARDARVMKSVVAHWTATCLLKRHARAVVGAFVARIRIALAFRRQWLVVRAWSAWTRKADAIVCMKLATERCPNAELPAEALEPEVELRRCFVKWRGRCRQRAAEREADAVDRTRTCARFLATWNRKFHHAVALRQQQKANAEFVARVHAMPRRELESKASAFWEEPSRHRLMAADAVRRASLVASCWGQWQRKFEVRGASLQEERQLTASCFRRWRAKYLCAAADRLRQWHVWRAWRRRFISRCMHESAEEQRVLALQRTALRQWSDRAAAVAYCRVGIARRCVEKWSRRAALRQLVAASAAIAGREQPPTFHCFRRWKRVTVANRQLRIAVGAVVSRAQLRVKRNLFLAWRSYTKACIASNANATVTSPRMRTQRSRMATVRPALPHRSRTATRGANAANIRKQLPRQ